MSIAATQSPPDILSLWPLTGDWPPLRGAVRPTLDFADLLVLVHWGGDLLQRFILTVDLRTSAGDGLSRYTVRGIRHLLVPSLSKDFTGRWWGRISVEQHLPGEAFTVEDTDEAQCWLSMTANIWRGILPASAPLQRKSTRSLRALMLFKSSSPSNISPNGTNHTDML